MPEICRFYGIVILMHPNDHNPPHFHAKYGDDEAMIVLNDPRVLKGNLSHKNRKLVIAWASQHQTELREAWDKRERGENPGKIPPLE